MPDGDLLKPGPYFRFFRSFCFFFCEFLASKFQLFRSGVGGFISVLATLDARRCRLPCTIYKDHQGRGPLTGEPGLVDRVLVL